MRISDWSSDVCSSDLGLLAELGVFLLRKPLLGARVRQSDLGLVEVRLRGGDTLLVALDVALQGELLVLQVLVPGLCRREVRLCGGDPLLRPAGQRLRLGVLIGAATRQADRKST